eukprot:7552073-Ditylum_brightwellii.AAC.2
MTLWPLRLNLKEKIIKSFKLSPPSASLKQTYHPIIHHTNKDSKYNSKGNPNCHLEAQVGKGKDFATRADFYLEAHPT